MTDKDDLAKLVNASGFAFQLKLEHAISKSDAHPWRVLSREHPWALGDAQGFIDLVLGYRVATCVIECKRSRGGTWVFLVPNGEEQKQSTASVVWIGGTKSGPLVAGSDSVEILPSSYQSAFCVVRGAGENDRPLLERLCSTLLLSCDALAGQETHIFREQDVDWGGYYIPMIVTTSELYACRFSAGAVSLVDGNLDSGDFEPVPYIRFKKAFSSETPDPTVPTTLDHAASMRERTVFVVQASHVVAFLAELKRPRYAGPAPWDEALARANREPA